MNLYLISMVVGLHEENLKQSKNGKKENIVGYIFAYVVT